MRGGAEIRGAASAGRRGARLAAVTWHAVSVLAGRAALVASVAAVLALAWLVPHRGLPLLRRPAGRALRHPRLAGLRRRAPGLHAFAERHLVDPRPSWLRLAAGSLFLAGGVAWFVQLLRGVLADGKLVTADRCLHNTVATFDSAALTRFYSLVSDLASLLFVAPLVAVLAALLWAAGRRREALGLVLALAGALALANGLKWLIARPRPAEAQALFRDSSFPSGHTLTGGAVYGFLVYLVLRDEPRRLWHWLLALPLLGLIGSIPLSRIYLGVHWPYDTVASMALAGAWLAILVTLFKLRWLERRLPAPPAPARWLPWGLAVLTLALCGYGALLAAWRPQRKVAPPPPVRLQIGPAAALVSYPARVLPATSEDAVGGPMEPVSLLLVGDAARVIAAFERAGWQLAEPPSVRGLLRELLAVAKNRPDPRGPATPAYLGGEPQDLTFEKPGDLSGSIRRRHHTRLWQTRLCLSPGCVPLWVATASYDAAVKLVAKPYLLTHRIDPRVDAERDLIAADLERAGARQLAVLTITGPTRGRNAGGDSFFTDGRARLLVVP
jgi:membrane-associated phospholipid phosphatase